MEIAKQLQELVYKAVCEVAGVCVPAAQIPIEHPEAEEHGDYSTNIALIMAKDLKQNPKELAEKIAARIEGAGVAGPGFINFKLQPKTLVDMMTTASQLPDIGQGKTVVIDYSAPNIAKPFGIGHFSSTIIGQALYNIYQSSGYRVIGDNHLGDWGTQFGKLLFMIDQTKTDDFSIANLEKLYVEFHRHPEWEDDGRKWFKQLEFGDPHARKMWQKCVEVSMAEFNRIYKLLDVQINYAYGESFYEPMLSEVVSEAKSRGVAVESQGALIIEVEGSKTPLMLLKSDGGTTYATRDLATLKFRGQQWHPDIVIYEVGAEQALHFVQVFAAAKQLGYVQPTTQLVHTKHGLYLDTDGKKFSTRKGRTVKLEEVLQEAIRRAKKLGNGDEITARAVGVGALKYFNLMHSVQSDVVFDWEKLMTLEGNSGPYLQYTYARARSVLAKVNITPSGPPLTSQDASRRIDLRGGRGSYNTEELSVLSWIYRYPEVVNEAATRFAPNLVCNFLFELAQRFNTLYAAHRIGSHPFRQALTQAVSEVLKSGLNLLGITALEKM